MPIYRWLQAEIRDFNRHTSNSTLDNTSSGLMGTVVGLEAQDMKCDNPGMRSLGDGGGIMVCLKSMTNGDSIVAAVCNEDVAEETPKCNGKTQIYDGSMIVFATDPATAKDCLQEDY